MTKMLRTTCIMLILLIGLAACGEKSDIPKPVAPKPDEVLRDVEALASNTLLGDADGVDGKFLFSPMIIEEMEVSWTAGDDTLDAEITAYVGDEKWRSEVKQTMIVHYALDASGVWEASGGDMLNPVVRVITRNGDLSPAQYQESIAD